MTAANYYLDFRSKLLCAAWHTSQTVTLKQICINVVLRSYNRPKQRSGPTSIMSGNPDVPDNATRAHEKVASKEARRARQEFMTGFSKIVADMEAKLAAAGITVDDEPEPDMTGIQVVDYSRHVAVPVAAGVPVNVAAADAIGKIYASEANLINNTVRVVQEYQQLFCQGPEDPPLFASAQEQALTIQAFVDHQRE